MSSIQRRSFIKGFAALSVAAGLHPLQTSAFMIDDNDPKTDFTQAQDKLLKKYGVYAQTKYTKLSKPSLSLHLLEAGRGEPVLMLHGGGSVACQMAPLMGALQNDFHLFVPDRPGCGLSDMINYNDVPSFRQHAVDCIASLLDNLKLDKVSLIGNSMGGYWALLFSLAHPERVSKLVLIGEPAASSPYGTGPFAPPADKNPSLQSITNLYQFLLTTNINNVAKEMLEADLAAAKIPDAGVAWDTMVDQFKKNPDLGTYALRPELKELKTQTLFIWGEKERFGPPKLGQEMAAIIPQAKCEVVADASHIVWLDKLEQCASLTKAFLKG